ncbi:universal stress protein [Salicibibacter halophilus]|uniref:Universal stress protein n=2 Tax=Salicibibacter halophilus TaxID=2502791 RepID=A0A514LKX1_9BACI|nr:universal stress protein [Salicibibacter halophilus]
MGYNMRSYQNILVGIDVHGQEWDKPFEQACVYAMNHDATLHIATVLNTKTYTTQERFDPKLKELKKHAYEMLEKYQQKAKDKGVSQVKTIFDTGSPKARITRHLAPQHDIDLIVVGANQANKAEKFILGSVADGIIREARCDVVTVK